MKELRCQIKTGRRPRVGQIDFSNCLPVNLPFARELAKFGLDLDLFADNPKNLNQLIKAGMLDMSAVSSYFYLSTDNLTLVPGLSISSLDNVGSVLFYYRDKLEAIVDKPITVPDSSATSIKLLALLLAIETGKKAVFKSAEYPEKNACDHGGFLLIGDRALIKDAHLAEKYQRIDLGNWWWQNFQLPMVFGLFVADDDFVKTRQVEFEKIAEALQNARDIGLGDMFEEVLELAGAKTSVSRDRLERYYLKELNFELSDDHIRGLNKFKTLLVKFDLLQGR